MKKYFAASISILVVYAALCRLRYNHLNKQERTHD
jgi:hypothetical protein